MNILENFRSAIFNILSSKMRTVLTTLGIIIGITSVVIITAIGKGYEIQAEKMLDGLDKETINVANSWNETIRDKDKIKLDDVNIIKGLNNVRYAAAEYSVNGTVKLKNPKQTKDVQLVGANTDTKGMKKIEIIYGRFLNEKDLELDSKVAVIDNKLAMDIFGREDALGETITIKSTKGDIDLTIVGIEKAPHNNLYFPHSVYSPILTVMNFGGNTDRTVARIAIKIDDISLFSKVEKEIVRTLAATHGNDPKKYEVTGNFQFSNSASGMIKMVTIFIGFVAGISLLVGGIGVMNIMLVTVTERTREIGIRKSLGATNGNIKFQFLIESMCISLLGGIIGIILGYSGIFMTKQILNSMGSTLIPAVSLNVVLTVFIISSLIGIIFGVYPAGKAAKLDPIEALRYE